MVNAYLNAIQQLYQPQANPEQAIAMKQYMRNQFEFLGIKTPQAQALFKQLKAAQGLPELTDLETVVRALWEWPEREYQYLALTLLDKSQRQLTPDFLPLLEYLITTKSWWDTVDFLAPKLAGKLLFRFPDRIADYPLRWIKADNRWLQRAAILFQLDYKAQTDAPLLFDLIRQRADSTDFFVQKAAGWALRQYARTNPETVRAFIREHELPKLTVREGMKHLKNERK